MLIDTWYAPIIREIKKKQGFALIIPSHSSVSITLSVKSLNTRCGPDHEVYYLEGGGQARLPTGAHGPRLSPSRGKGSRVLHPVNCSAV